MLLSGGKVAWAEEPPRAQSQDALFLPLHASGVRAETCRTPEGLPYCVAGGGTEPPRAISSVPAAELLPVLKANPPLLNYFVKPQLLFYYPEGYLEVAGQRMRAVRDPCADTNLMTQSAARRCGLRVVPSGTRLSSSTDPN